MATSPDGPRGGPPKRGNFASSSGRCNDDLGASGGAEPSTALEGNGGSFRGKKADGSTVEYSGGHIYEGELKGGERCGWGTMTYASGNVYVGEWKDDLPHGCGTVTSVSGEIYKREFKKGFLAEKSDEQGFHFENGDVYVGELKGGERHGRGVCRFVSGDVYDGEWVDDEMHGVGTFTMNNGHVYKGDLRDGMMHGKGKLNYEDGSVYEGDWKNGERNGSGTFKWEGGCVYDGEWKDNAKHGRGTFWRKNGDVYVGDWADGEENGWGARTYATGNDYEGLWKGGMQHGKGTFRWKDGNVYEGDWVEDKPHGRGTLTYASGNIYEGQWLEGREQGEGTMKWKDGRILTGEFVGGKCHGWGTMTYASGDVYEGQWVEGKQHGKAFKTKGGKKAKRKEGRPPSAPVSVQANDAPPATSSELTNERTRELPDKIYGERQLRSQRSQQRRLQSSEKTCEHCGVDDVRYKLRVCTGCNLALYCSAACQKAASGSHRRICDIISQLPSRDADRLALEYGEGEMIDFDAGLRYGKKYMDNMKHLTINLNEMTKGDAVKLSAMRLSSLLRSKKGTLDSVSWISDGNFDVSGITENCHDVWKELHGLKQLRLELMQFDDIQSLRGIIDQQRNTLMVLCLPYLLIDWSKAKCRRTLATAVSACKHLVKLELASCVLTDSDLKVILQDLPNLRSLILKRDTNNMQQFSDKTCSLIARKCPGLQELNLAFHDQLSVRGIRKIFEGCVHLRSFVTSTCKLSSEDVQKLLDIAPQLLFVSLNKEIGIAEKEIDAIIEATGGRTVFLFNDGGNHYVYNPGEILSAETRANYEHQKQLGREINCKRGDPEMANQWEVLLD